MPPAVCFLAYKLTFFGQPGLTKPAVGVTEVRLSDARGDKSGTSYLRGDPEPFFDFANIRHVTKSQHVRGPVSRVYGSQIHVGSEVV